ncbi:Glutathione S-transferase [Mycena venus]|uniref:Glutathione S-transferase n=1 Tax=Mycena venus TaxID=2733690 RepID=A0A8H6Y759_9AGAR|nr:Glutathione S-transferase [Mycena venus]
MSKAIVIHARLCGIELNPNGRIPVLVDRSRDNFVVFETAAILLYLAQHYDKNKVFYFDAATEPNYYSETVDLFRSWRNRPNAGPKYHFQWAAPEDIPYAKKRFVDETKRLYGVLEIRLSNGRDWVRIHKYADVQSLDEFPNVKAWLKRTLAKPAIQAGIAVPPSKL